MSESGFQQLQVMKESSGGKRRSYSERHAQNQPIVTHRRRTRVLLLRSGSTTERKIIQLLQG